MRELTPATITDAVLDQMATTPDPRLKTIMASAVNSLRRSRGQPSFPEAEDSDEAIQGTATGRETWVLEVKQYRVIE